MNKELAILEKLQRVDLEIDQIISNKKEFPLAIEKLNLQVQSELKKLSDKQVQIKALELKRNQLDLELKQKEEKIKKSDEKLMSVKSNEELQAMKREISLAKEENSVIEDQELEVLLQIDKGKEELVKLEQQVAGNKERIENEIAEITKQLSSLDGELKKHEADKKNEISSLDKETLSIYNRVRSKEPLAVTETNDGKCSGCSMSLPPQLYNEIQTAKNVLFCPNCQRILVYKKQ